MLKRKHRITPLDLFVCAMLAVLAGYAAYSVTVRLHYNWNWGVIPQYLVHRHPATGRWAPNYLLEGLFTTIRLSFWAGIMAICFGIAMALMRTGRSLFGRLVSRSFVELMRNMPPLVVIFIFYFFIADQILPHLGIEARMREASGTVQKVVALFLAPGLQLEAFLAALLTLAVFEGAYMTEIVRAGIESIEKGQWEAAHALGLSKWHTLRHVVLPQALQRMLPALSGQFISLIKDSSIVSVISIQELAYQGTQLMASTYLTIETWVTVTLMYLALTLTFSLALSRLENRFSRKFA